MVNKKQHNIALIMLSVTAIVWGVGFVLGNRLLGNGFGTVPFALNTIRFVCGALVLVAVFARKIKFDKTTLLFGCVGGALLCAAFDLQLLGLNVSHSPTACGFFTAAYTVFVPFVAWILYKKRPGWLMFVGAGVAFAGLIVLNIDSITLLEDKNVLIGNMITLGGSLLFAIQIVLSDYALHRKNLQTESFTVVQIATCAILMCIVSAIAEGGKYASVQVDWGNAWWQLAITAVMGTAFAYYSQTFAQQHLSPTEASIIMACESPIGAIFAISLGDDKFSWAVCVGGVLIIASVVLIEILPDIIAKRKEIVKVPMEPPVEKTTDVEENDKNNVEQ